MWRDLILAIDPEAVCQPPANTEQIVHLEAALGVKLPTELADLLREMNGAEVSYVSIVWSTGEIAQRNIALRRQGRADGLPEGHMPVEHLLFFGDRGSGDLYGFPIGLEGVRNEVFLWDHEDDSQSYQASSLHEWLSATG